MPKFIIERNIPGAGRMSAAELKGACQKSNNALNELNHWAQWQQSYVTDDKLYCVYLSRDKNAILEHAEKSGFPADRIEVVKTIIDPTSAE
ncbi:MAG TPA: DUF4242 domain-containing protein [Membranihabitans sp.]|nr:DUF4242 domain-containing protein [Membranihabitans sp.]